MSGTRTLKLSILADVDNLKSQLNKADTEVQSFGGKLGEFGKVAAAAFAAATVAAAAYATKLAVDGVKAAIEDQAAQEKLATSLKNVTGATDAQVASVEAFILATSLATGVADDKLRPALDRLTRSTKDVKESQQLLKLAMDISAGTGKSLESVTNALAKAHDGQTTALGKLGVGIDAASLKEMSFDTITKTLSTTFKDQASIQAETYAGKMERLKVAFSEGKETVGAYILDAINPLVDGFVKNVIPAIGSTSDKLGKTLGPTLKEWGGYLTATFKPILEGIKNAWSSISKAITDNQADLKPLVDALKAFGEWAGKTLGPLLGTTLKVAFEVMGKAIAGVVTAVSTLVSWFKTLWDWGGKVKDFLTFGGGGSQKASFSSASFLRTSSGSYTDYGAGTGDGTPTWDVPAASDGTDRILSLAEALASPGLAGTLAANANAQGMSVSDYYASRGGVYAGTGYYGDAPTVLTQKQYFGAYESGGVDALNALTEKLQGTNQVTINVTGTVVDPQGVARAVEDAFTTAANATGSFTSLGLATTALVSV